MTTIRHDKRYFRDRAAVFAFRTLITLAPKQPFGPEGRQSYDKMIARTPTAQGVTYEADTVGGVPGWWCRPVDPIGARVILYLHGGGYVMGSSAAYKYFAGHIAKCAGLATFVADYALAPEFPFPAAMDDAMAAYQGLATLGYTRIVLAGDSAGGGLCLALLAKVIQDESLPRPCAALALSPLTDCALTGNSIESRAKADPVIKKQMLADTALMYLGDHDRRTPDASPLYGDLSGLPPVLIHVGDYELLLDDSVRYAQRLEAAGGSVELHVWRGMPHVFCGFVGMLKVASEALNLAGAFIRRLN